MWVETVCNVLTFGIHTYNGGYWIVHICYACIRFDQFFCPTLQPPHIYNNWNALCICIFNRILKTFPLQTEAILHSSFIGQQMARHSATFPRMNYNVIHNVLRNPESNWESIDFYHRMNSIKFWLFVVSCATPIQSRHGWEIFNNGINKETIKNSDSIREGEKKKVLKTADELGCEPWLIASFFYYVWNRNSDNYRMGESGKNITWQAFSIYNFNITNRNSEDKDTFTIHMYGVFYPPFDTHFEYPLVICWTKEFRAWHNHWNPFFFVLLNETKIVMFLVAARE